MHKNFKSLQNTNPSNMKKAKAAAKGFPIHLGFYRNPSEYDDRTTTNRDYGLKSSKGSGTPFPQKQKKLDTAALTAKLETDSLLRSELSDLSIVISERKASSEPQVASNTTTEPTFEMRRKLFDEAEFTICKGHKLNQDFHHIVEDEKHFNKRQSAKDNIPYSNFMDLKNFCDQNNIKFSKGFDG
uniref:Inhibitor-t protein n=1 Tax=Drosophila melanogaster TaxID=7227 RepID=O96723_DROME|nr:Inhibitor-t protein [Drosophila melanogaster]